MAPDGNASADELVYRRIGHNELGAIAVSRGFVAAQRRRRRGHDGDPAGIYALKLISDEGTQNGLYWPVADGETPSPAAVRRNAAAEGYQRNDSGTGRTTATTSMIYARGRTGRRREGLLQGQAC